MSRKIGIGGLEEMIVDESCWHWDGAEISWFISSVILSSPRSSDCTQCWLNLVSGCSYMAGGVGLS